MVESNYDILKIQDGASKKDIRMAYRSLVLKLHSDRGGDDEQFKRIKRAYEDLRLGKKYPDSADERKEKAKFYSGDSDADQRRKNLLLSQDKFWAGNFTYDNPVMMWGSITSPYISSYEKHKTHIHLTNGDFRMIDSIRNRYDIDGGAKITVDNGNMEVGNVRGKRQRVEDPQGRVGMSTTREHFSELSAPNGKIVTGDVRDTVKLDADTIITLNLIDNIKVTGKNILVYGTKVTYDVEFFLKKDGKIRFYDQGSGFDISDDATINLENGKSIKIRDLKHDKLISLGGKDITYDYIDDRENIKKSNKNNSGNKFGFGKMFHK